MPHLSRRERIRFGVESLIMTRLAPLDRPGRVLRWIFKIPLLLYRLRLFQLVPKNVLILVTTGRKTGKLRRTALEYGYDAATNAYVVMAGWTGRTDWYRNARADPHVTVQIRGFEFTALAEPMPVEQVARLMAEVARLNPGALAMWSRRAGCALDGSEVGLRQAAPWFPSLILRPQDAVNGIPANPIAQSNNP